jgi:hypothetical protein
MPTLNCPGGRAPLSGAEKIRYSANTAAATAGATAKVQTDADTFADLASRGYQCIPSGSCRECQRHVSLATAVAGTPTVTHWSLINVISRIFGGSADYTATLDYTWTATVTCDCRDL